MTSRDFCFWLQGYFEILGKYSKKGIDAVPMTKDQIDCIVNHLSLVFKHEIDPSIGGDQQELQDIHDGTEMKELPFVYHKKPGDKTPVWNDFLLRC